MKRVPETTLSVILTIILLSSDTLAANVNGEVRRYSSQSTISDTINAKLLIEVDSFRLPIIPPSSGVQFYKDGVVFLSTSKYESKMSSNHISFGAVEAYYAPIGDSSLGKHVLFSPVSSFSFPCEAMTFSRDYNTVYFTMIPKKEKKEKIFVAKLSPDNKIPSDLAMQITPLEFCSDNYNYSHPALSNDENILIFASDREGSLGGMDLFLSRRTGEKWSQPENMGKFINTSGNEFFPFLDSENNLYYSSDGLPGSGGYDIFTCKFNGVSWDKPVNLSDGINSAKDDIAFTISKTDGKTAFFSRRDGSEKGNLQLYRVILKKEAAESNLLTLSDIFNGKPNPKGGILAAASEADKKPAATETSKTKTVTESDRKAEAGVPEKSSLSKKPEEKINISKPSPKVIPDENKTVDAKPAPKTSASENKAVEVKNAPKTATNENKKVETKPVPPSSVEQSAGVVYRVQIFSGTTPGKTKEISINGKSYNFYEYVYLGATRYTIGEFTTLSAAVDLQRTCRLTGNPQAFVVAFKNNTRSLDPNLFK
jgi:hypothetical protein